jgi:hypothetical protein
MPVSDWFVYLKNVNESTKKKLFHWRCIFKYYNVKNMFNIRSIQRDKKTQLREWYMQNKHLIIEYATPAFCFYFFTEVCRLNIQA